MKLFIVVLFSYLAVVLGQGATSEISKLYKKFNFTFSTLLKWNLETNLNFKQRPLI